MIFRDGKVFKFQKEILVASLSFLSFLPLYSYATDPEHVALVDTGYDQCVLSGGDHCENNKNLLFRGALPLPDDPPLIFNFKHFRENMMEYLTHFNQVFSTRATLPKTVEDLKNYRIVDIDLIYDYNQQGDKYESDELQYEFKDSGQVAEPQLPDQHKMYGLEAPFDENKYAFEWWPVTFAQVEEDDPQFVPMQVNWPSKMGTPPHSFEPQVYQLLDLPYLITGIAYAGDEEPDAKDLATLLKTIPQDGHPLLIYYHCIAGKDRTGAVSASYFMKHGGYPYYTTVSATQKNYRSAPVNLAQAIKYTTLPDREPQHWSKEVSKGYCLTLDKGPGGCDLG